MKKKVITDNINESLTIQWDGERFSLICKLKHDDLDIPPRVLIMNPLEMLELVKFADSLGGE